MGEKIGNNAGASGPADTRAQYLFGDGSVLIETFEGFDIRRKITRNPFTTADEPIEHYISYDVENRSEPKFNWDNRFDMSFFYSGQPLPISLRFHSRWKAIPSTSNVLIERIKAYLVELKTTEGITLVDAAGNAEHKSTSLLRLSDDLQEAFSSAAPEASQRRVSVYFPSGNISIINSLETTALDVGFQRNPTLFQTTQSAIGNLYETTSTTGIPRSVYDRTLDLALRDKLVHPAP